MQVKHGTNQGWIHGCRRKCCVLARHRFRRKNNILGGRPVRVPVEEAVRVLDEILRRTHLTQEELSEYAGVDERTFSRWRTGYVRTVTTYTLDKVRRVSRVPVRPARVPIEGPQRRIQAMCHRGFSQRWQSQQSGIPVHQLSALSKGLRQTVSREEADVIAQLHRTTLLLPDPEGPSAGKTRASSRRLGFLPAGVWKDIDDPECEPDTLQDPDLHRAVLRARRLAVRGFLMSDIAADCGIATSNFYRFLYEHALTSRPETVKKINEACDRYEPLPDPTGRLAQKTKNLAKKKGWDKC